MADELTDRQLLLRFIGSLTLADHMGDVSNDIDFVLRRIMPDIGEWEELSDLGDELGRRGITTLYGTSLAPEDEPEDDV